MFSATIIILSFIWGFRREEEENRVLLGHYTGSSGNLLQTFRDKPSAPSPGFG
jgi:hypothetical protein